MIEYLKALVIVIGASFQVNRVIALLILVLTILQALSATMFAIASGFFVDAAADLAHSGLLLWAIVLVLAIGARWLLGSVATHNVVRMQREVAHVLDTHLIALDSRLLGLEHHERSDYLAQFELLRDEHWRLGFALSAIIEGLALVIQLAASVLVLLQVHPVLGVLPLCGIPSLLATARVRRMITEVDERLIERVRLSRYFFNLGTSAAAGKELRVFGLADEVIRRHYTETSAVIATRQRVHQAGTILQAVGRLTFIVGYLAAIIVVVAQAIEGRGSAGSIIVVISLANQIWGLMNRSMDTLTWLLATLRVVGRIRWLEQYAQRQRSNSDQATLLPPSLRHGIDLDGVSFRYPDTPVDVLENVHLHLPAGTTVALVGDNGAGKSTLVKLLCQFYEPTSGHILVDGVDLAQVGIRAWRQRLAGAFQDYARFELLARETIGVGDLPSLENGTDDAIMMALDRSGTTDVLAALPEGLETPLGPGYNQAIDLSGGQWQKLALARSCMRKQPLLLILDEPTAALDPQAEHALFERFAQLADEMRTHGGITLLVSHRFSTVRMADLIVVLTQHRVQEVGTHDQLMALQGLYAELYTLQANAYRTTPSTRQIHNQA